MTPKQKKEFLYALLDWFKQDMDLEPGQWSNTIAAVGVWHDEPDGEPQGLAVQPADGEPFLLRFEDLPGG